MAFKDNGYPENFPKGCPPEVAEARRIKVYRMVKNEDRVIKEDFLSYIELGKNISVKRYPFIEYGLSINTDYKELKNIRRSSPLLKKMYKSIAEGFTYECTGVIEETPTKSQKHHCTWWKYKEVDPSNFFKIKKEEGELNDK